MLSCAAIGANLSSCVTITFFIQCVPSQVVLSGHFIHLPFKINSPSLHTGLFYTVTFCISLEAEEFVVVVELVLLVGLDSDVAVIVVVVVVVTLGMTVGMVSLTGAILVVVIVAIVVVLLGLSIMRQ
jgi:hypothetical protein